MIIILFYWILIPIFWLAIPVIALFNSKIQHHFLNEKNTIKSAKYKIKNNSSSKIVIHFHAASTGEFEQLKPILQLIDRKKNFVLVSFYSPTVFNLEKDTELADAVCYHPFDFPWSAWYFFKKLNIKYYIITRNDIWPTHLFIANKLKIYSILINANIYKKSHYKNLLYRSFFKSVLNRFDLILTGSERLKTNLAKLVSHNKIVITGDSRLDRVLHRKQEKTSSILPNVYKTSNTLILGSIVPSDYNIIFKGIGDYYNNDFNILKEKKHRIIVAPHEINNYDLKQIEHNLSKIKFEFSYLSDKNNLSNSNIIIIDKIGILADLYFYSNIAYIGAGFSSGVHSVLEPTVYNNAVSFGPNYEIVDIAVSLTNRNLASVIHNSNDFKKFCNLLDDNKALKVISNNIKNYIAKQPIAAETILNEIINVN